MRLFFGFDLDAGSKSAIADWRDRHALAGGRPVPAANFHITLAFLGELDERRLERLCDRVDAAQAEMAERPLSLSLDRVGYWPSPGIYWLGTSADCAAMTALAARLASVGQALGSRRERRAFEPHVTLYRRCDTPPPAPSREPLFDLQLTELLLFQSQQGRSGVSYRPLAAWPL
jgi:2'-5' RNA ligase